MKIKVSYTVNVTDDYRRALRHHYGKTGMATREELQNHFQQHGWSMDDDLMFEYQQHCESKPTTREATPSLPRELR